MSQPPIPPPQGLPTNTQPFPGSLTPGWNDPPSIQYNAQATGTPGRTKLNKRVPFPLQQTNTCASPKPTAIVQPCPAIGPTSNIAVVHPLQHTMQELSTPPTTTATATIPEPVTDTSQQLPRESIGNQINLVPTNVVPAVPRQTDATQGAVQHL